MAYLGDFAEDATVTFPWYSVDRNGVPITRSTDGTVYVEKVGALASSSATAATITKATPGVVTDTAHGLLNGDEAFFYNLSEMTEVNQTLQTVANKADNTFEIENTGGHGFAETTGGAWVQVNAADVTDTEDYKGVTGSHLCSIDTSADDYFTAGADYIVYLLEAVIDGQTVSVPLAHFSIEYRFAEVAVTSMATDVLSADALKADAATEIATAVLAATADGIALSVILTRINAMIKGKIVRTGDTYVYKKEDGAATSHTNILATGGRNL